MKILVVEDDPILRQSLCAVIKSDGFAVDEASDKQSALESAEVNEYDCIILDINLPDGNGFEVLHDLRSSQNDTPVIIVTARGETQERVKGLNLGADDYLPKPVDTNELIARLRAVIRRNSNQKLPVITIGELIIKPAEHQALVRGEVLDFTAKEFAVLEYMGQHHGHIITRSMLMEHVWGSDFDTFSNVIDVYVKNIRQKLAAFSAKSYIKTIRGKGYILEAH